MSNSYQHVGSKNETANWIKKACPRNNNTLYLLSKNVHMPCMNITHNADCWHILSIQRHTMLTQIHLYSCSGRTVILSLPSVSSETDKTVDKHIQLSRCCPSKKLGQFEQKSDHQVSFRSIPFDGLDSIYRHIAAFLTPQNLVPAMNLASRTPPLHSQVPAAQEVIFWGAPSLLPKKR